MLVLSRRANEKIVVGGDIVITVLEVGRGQVRLGIEAPKDCRILRYELVVEVGEENRRAVAGADAAAALDALLDRSRNSDNGTSGSGGAGL
jgi:carbon storage regulator